MDPSATSFQPAADHFALDADLHGHPRTIPTNDGSVYNGNGYTNGNSYAAPYTAPAAPVALQVKLLREGARAPTRGSAFAAGYDMYAAEAKTVPARGQALVSAGIAIAVPQGTYGRVAPRSGLAVKHSIATGAGVIDEDYRGEVFVLLFNLGDKDFNVNTGDRVAQLVLERIFTPDIAVVEELSETVRGAGGFGSTGGFGMAGDVKMVM